MRFHARNPALMFRPPTDDVRIDGLRPLIPPAILMEEIHPGEEAIGRIAEAREQISDIVHGKDDRLLAVVGPCSIHDPQAALDYAKRLKALRDEHADDLLIVMRTYFEKPRTTVGWKGLINDPNLDGSFDINRGLRVGSTTSRARHLQRRPGPGPHARGAVGWLRPALHGATRRRFRHG